MNLLDQGQIHHGSGDADARAKRKRGGSAAASEASVAAGTAALDSTLSYPVVHSDGADDAPDSVGQRRAIRWGARALLWQASTLRPVRQCGRVLRDDDADSPSTGVGVKRRELAERTVAGYSGVTLCGSVWACPRCSAVVAQRRAEEISRAVAACHARGGSVYLMTLTIRHRRGDALTDLFKAISNGWSKVVESQQWKGVGARTQRKRGGTVFTPAVMGDAERFGIAGRIRSTEATVSTPGSGGHGWHLHFHVLLFAIDGLGVGLRADLDDYLAMVLGHRASWERNSLAKIVFGQRVFARYASAVARSGFRADIEGFDLREVHDGGSEFIGSYLAKSTYDVAARIGYEVASGAHTKETRSERNLTPFEVLARCAADLDARRFGIRTPRHWETVELDDSLGILDLDTGEVTAFTSPGLWKLWHEWERASKGQRQVVWSHVPKADSERRDMWIELLSARGEDKKDEEVAKIELQGERLGEIPREAWYGRLGLLHE